VGKGAPVQIFRPGNSSRAMPTRFGITARLRVRTARKSVTLRTLQIQRAISLRRPRRLLQQLAGVAGKDGLALLAERAQLLDEIANRRAVADFLGIVGGEDDA
jgi:hypothetical protein